jgi:hypothetical protein
MPLLQTEVFVTRLTHQPVCVDLELLGSENYAFTPQSLIELRWNVLKGNETAIKLSIDPSTQNGKECHGKPYEWKAISLP